MTSVALDKSILLSAQRALHDVARQFQDKPTEPGQTRSLSYSEVVAQLKSRQDGGASASVLAASIQGAPEITPPVVGAQKPTSAAEDEFDPTKLSGAAAIRYWVALVQEKVESATDEQLVKTMQRFSEAKKTQQDLAIKEEGEAIAKEEAAQRASELMGCISKIVGAVIVAASVVSSLVTGGSSLVFAGIGLALMAADYIAEAATGESLTGRLISPLMEHIFSPMAKAMGDVIANALKGLGVDSDIADTIGAVAGAVAVAIVVVAAAVVAKSANLGKLAGKMAAPMMKSAAKMMPKIISNVSSKLTAVMSKAAAKADAIRNTITRNLSRITEKIGLGTAELASAQASRVALVAGGVNGTAQAGHGAWQGINANQLAQLSAALTERLGEHDGLTRMMDMAVDFWKQQSSQKSALEQLATDSMQSSQNAQLFVLNNARNAAV